jgi:hypothetical protein
MRATTSAITLLVAGVTGLALGPALVGGISGALSARGGGHALQNSLVIVELLAVGVIVPLLVAAPHLRREHENRVRAEVPSRIPSPSLDRPLKEGL